MINLSGKAILLTGASGGIGTVLARAFARAGASLALVASPGVQLEPLRDELRAAGAFRADVSGAGPAVYGLFVQERDAKDAAHRLRTRGRVWLRRREAGCPRPLAGLRFAARGAGGSRTAD